MTSRTFPFAPSRPFFLEPAPHVDVGSAMIGLQKEAPPISFWNPPDVSLQQNSNVAVLSGKVSRAAIG